MNEVLGRAAGNALEIEESILFLRDDVRESRLNDVTMALCAEMLVVAGEANDRSEAAARCEEAVSSGRAAEKFAAMVEALGGPGDLLEKHSDYLPKAPVIRPVIATGIVMAVDTRAVGNAIIELGGGRRVVGEKLDLAVGFNDIAPIRTELDRNTPLAVIHAASEDDAKKAERNLLAAVSLGDEMPAERPVICEILTG
jgi:thymidine phosphorylase